MLFLCPEDKFRTYGRFYYFDFQSELTYLFGSGDYLDKELQGKMPILPLFAGAFLAIIGITFKDVCVSFNYLTLPFFAMFGLALGLVFYFGFVSDQNRNFKIAKGKIVGMDVPFEELNNLFMRGWKVRFVVCFSIGVISFLLLCGIQVASETKQFKDVLMVVFAFALYPFTFRLLSPIQIIKFKLYLRRCKKECQKK